MQQQKHRPGHLRRTHAASLAANRDPLSMAEELLQKQQHNLELQDQLVRVTAQFPGRCCSPLATNLSCLVLLCCHRNTF